MNLKPKCPLCHTRALLFYETPRRKYYQCNHCSSVFLDSEYYVSEEDERKRYEKHNNDIEDPGYQKFVEPIVCGVEQHFDKKHKGLDFGSGTGPVIAKLLRDKGYTIELYDPFFCNNPEKLEKTYDFIVCCEVMEHFHFPAKEFSLLRSILKHNGALFCMTDIFSERVDFRTWYYKNDATHVFFYHRNALALIQSKFIFSTLVIDGRFIQFFA